MVKDSLQAFIEAIGSSWGPLSTELIASCQREVEALVRASPTEPWLAALHAESPEHRALHRDTTHGFELLAHAEPAGLYRPPHDHGRGWVIYAVQQGESEMGTYARHQGPDGRVRLVKRDTTILRAGQVRVFLPGDIHDTRSLAGPTLLLRFSDRDLRREDRDEHRVLRYVAAGGGWTEPCAA